MRFAVPMREAALRLPHYHAPLEGRATKLRLDFNENTVGCSQRVRAALARLSPGLVAIYPEYEETRRRLARFFEVAPTEILLTNGADDALRLIADVFLERGTAALVVEPTFPMYHFFVQLSGARLLRLRYSREMKFPMEAVCRALARGPRVFFLANPNNPTGTLVSLAQLQKLLGAARRTLVVVDEAYWEFSGASVLEWIRRYPNLAVVRTFSKAAGLAGLRLGCLFANSALAGALRRAQPPYAVNAAALVAADAAVRDAASIQRYAREVCAVREELRAALAGRGITSFPSAGNFLLADFGPGAPRMLRVLAQSGILLRDRSEDFGRPGFVRITIGTRAQMRGFLAALDAAWPG